MFNFRSEHSGRKHRRRCSSRQLSIEIFMGAVLRSRSGGSRWRREVGTTFRSAFATGRYAQRDEITAKSHWNTAGEDSLSSPSPRKPPNRPAPTNTPGRHLAREIATNFDCGLFELMNGAAARLTGPIKLRQPRKRTLTPVTIHNIMRQVGRVIRARGGQSKWITA